jgi:hypothetical protein
VVDWEGTTQRVAWAFAGMVLLLAVGACTAASRSTRESESPQPGASTAAGESAPPSTVPTPEPTPGFEAPAGILPPNSRAVVIVDALQVREQPGLNAAVEDTLPEGTVVELALGWTDPVEVDGIDWYHVDYNGALAGSVAGGVGGDRYLELLPPRCEGGDPDLAALDLTDWERLACLGSRPLTVIGTFGCYACGIPYPRGGYEPRWLASPDTLSYLDWQGGGVVLHFPPEAGLNFPPNASIMRVTGHFNDPVSSTCVIRPTMDGVPIGAEVDPVIAELWCREQFVVDAYEIIGTDPDFTYSFPPS